MINIKHKERASFIPYITAGDPDLKATRLFVRAFADAGVDAIELGVPFSDPVADGPTNQAAAQRGIASGTTLESIIRLVAEMRSEGLKTPIVLFTYLNPIFRLGYQAFAAKAATAGVNGVLVVDLPPEEARGDYLDVVRASGLDTIFLSSPTTARDRLKGIDEASSGFVYYTSRTGVTGVRGALTDSVTRELDEVRKHLTKPVAVGFGISTPEHVKALTPHADAIVVGSAFVKLIEANKPEPAALAMSKLAESMMKELKKC